MYHLFAEMHYIQLSIVTIMAFPPESLSLQSRFNIYRLNMLIEKQLSDLNKNVAKDPAVSSLDIETLVKIEKDYYKLKSTVEEYTQLYFEFLELIASHNPDLNRVESLNLTMMQLRRDAETVFNDTLSNNPRSMIYFSNYSHIFLFMAKKAGSIRKKTEILQEKLKVYKQKDILFYDLNLMFTERSAIIQLGAGLDNLGKIINVNIGAAMLTRYTIQEMLTSNVNRIMTQTISIHHQGYLLRAYKEGVFSIMYKEQRNFVVDKMGYSTPISLLVKPMYVIADNKFQYISYLQPLPTNSAFILTNSQGLVESFSEPISRLLGLEPKWVLDRKIYLQAFIPMFIDFFVEKEYRNMGQLENIEVSSYKKQFMQDSYCLRNLPKTIHSELKGRLFCYGNKSHHEDYHPFGEPQGHSYSRYSANQVSSRLATTWRETVVDCRRL